MHIKQFKGLFITGSDTDIGKTYISCQLIDQLRSAGITLTVRKPVESGCQKVNGELHPADGALLHQHNNFAEDLVTVTPLRFEAALAPHRAASLENASLLISDLTKICRSENFLLVEGAGGFLSPLANDGLNRDLALALGLPVVIVVDDRLGAVNQALLTIESVLQSGLEIAFVVFNQSSASIDSEINNIEDIQPYCDTPLFRCGYNKTLQLIFTD